LVYPREAFLKRIPKTSREAMIERGWPLPVERIGQVPDLRELVIKLRNGIAHCNIEFKTNGCEIEGIEFKNFAMQDVNKVNPLWIGVYKVDQLRRFVDMFLALINRKH